MSERKFSEDVKVSKGNLDTHLEEQSELVGFYGSKVAEAREARDDLKGKLDLKRADKRLYYKMNPPAGIPKPTADDIDALVATDPDVQAVQAEYVKACREHDDYCAAERAIEAKGKALGHLTSLYNASYFATSTASRGYRPET